MAHLIPPHYPTGTSPGEVLMFQALASAPASWVVLHSLHIPEHVRQIEGEADFVVLIPSLGVLCIEVKAHLSADFRAGAWYLGSNPAPDYRGPFRQAEEAARSIRNKVAETYPDASRLLFWPVVVFTHCVPSIGATTGDEKLMLSGRGVRHTSLPVAISTAARKLAPSYSLQKMHVFLNSSGEGP